MENETIKRDARQFKDGNYHYFIRRAGGGCITGFQHKGYSSCENEMVHTTYADALARLFAILFYDAGSSAEVKALMADLGALSISDIGCSKLLSLAEAGAKAELEDDKI